MAEAPVVGPTGGSSADGGTAFFRSVSAVQASFTTMEKSLDRIVGQNGLLSKFTDALEAATKMLSGVGSGKTTGASAVPSHWPLQPYTQQTASGLAVPVPWNTTQGVGSNPGTAGVPAPPPPSGGIFSSYISSGIAAAKAHPIATGVAAVGVASFVGGKAGSGYLKQATPTFDAAGTLDTLAANAGQFTPYASAHVASAIANTPFSQGIADAATSYGVASHYAGQSYLGNRSTEFIKNAQSIASANPGMSLADAAQAYGSLLSPSVVNTLGKRYGIGPIQAGTGKYTSINALAKGIVQSTTGLTNPTAAQAQSSLQPYGPNYAGLSALVGGSANADLLLNQFIQTTGGGKTITGNSPVTAAEAKQGAQSTKSQAQFYQRQEDDFAHLINLQTDINKTLSAAFARSGMFGILGVEIEKLSGSVLELVGGVALLKRFFPGGGGTPTPTGPIGDVGGGAAGEAEGAGALGEVATAAGGVGFVGGGLLVGGAAVSAYSIFQGAGPGTSKASQARHKALLRQQQKRYPTPGPAPIGDPPMSVPDSRAISDLEGRNHAAAGDAGVTGLNPSFRDKVAAMFEANPRLQLNSGFRSVAQQTALWNAAVKKYGSAQAARKWVAPPGSSMHNKGLAVDIGPSSEYGWLKQNAPKYGLWNYPPEPWHWEPQGARAGASGGDEALASAGASGSSSATTSSTASLSGASMTAFAPAGTGTTFSTQSAILAGLGISSSGGASAPGGFDTSSAIGGGSGGTGASSSAAGQSTGGGSAAPSKNMQQFINEILPFAQEQSRRTGIPVSVFLAQSGNETGWGTSSAWTKHLNPAGIDITGPGVAGGSYPNIAAAFQAYANRLSGIGERGQGPFMSLVKQHAPVPSILKALEQSPWAAGHYGGNGLENIYKNYNLGKYDTGDPPTLAGSPSGHMQIHNHWNITVPNATELQAQRLVTLVMSTMESQSNDGMLAGN